MDWTHNTIWRDQLRPDQFVTIEYEGNRPAPAERTNATYFELYKFKAKHAGLHEVGGIDSAEYLEVNFSNITSFEGISRLGRIKRLELSWCLKLNSDAGLSEIANDLEWLHISTSRKFTPTRDLFALRRLKVLCLNGCGPLDNLRFLNDMPDLLDFRFVDTNVLDGDLTPIVAHPNLTNAGFLDKRHFNLKSAQIEALFAGRQERAIEYAYKGEFRTYRYKALGRRSDA